MGRQGFWFIGDVTFYPRRCHHENGNTFQPSLRKNSMLLSIKVVKELHQTCKTDLVKTGGTLGVRLG